MMPSQALSMAELPSVTELFTLRQLSARHPRLLPESRLRWVARNRAKNGMLACGAVYESPVGELIFHEASTLRWLLGLTGRAKPRLVRSRNG